MHMRTNRLKPLKMRYWLIEDKPETDIGKASPEELNYLAALIDGEGNLDIQNTQLRIRVGMKSLLPVRLARLYGGCWYPEVRKEKGTVSYTWYIRSKLLEEVVELVMPYSKVKREEFELLRKALEIQAKKERGWKSEMRKIAKKLRELHHMNPTVIFKAARKLDETTPGWREWVRPGTVIEMEP